MDGEAKADCADKNEGENSAQDQKGAFEQRTTQRGFGHKHLLAQDLVAVVTRAKRSRNRGQTSDKSSQEPIDNIVYRNALGPIPWRGVKRHG